MATNSQEPGPGRMANQGTAMDMGAACDQACQAAIAHGQSMASNVAMSTEVPTYNMQ